MNFNISRMVGPAMAFIVLVLFDKMPDKHILKDPYFDRQKWPLRNAYLVLSPTIILVWLPDFSVPYGLYASLGLSLLADMMFAMVVCSLYYLLIHKPYDVDNTLFGLDKSNFLTKGILTGNIVIPISLVAFHFAGYMTTVRPIATARPAPEAAMIVAYSLLHPFVIIPLHELVFRGVLYPPVARKVGRYGAIVVLSFIQCLINSDSSINAGLPVFLSAAVPTFLFSFMCYGIYVRTRSLYPTLMVQMAMEWWVIKLELYGALESRVSAATFDQLWWCTLVGILIAINLYWIWTSFVKKGDKQNICE